MKRTIALVLAVMLCFGLCACGQDQNEVSKDINTDYVGAWKGNIKVGYETYEVQTITLNTDGTGSYQGKYDGAWKYSEEDNRIVLATDAGNILLDIDTVDGKTVLKYFSDVYYRASEFVE